MNLKRLAALAALALFGCAGSSPHYSGTPGQAVDAVLITNIFFTPVSVNGGPQAYFGLDTGDPIDIVGPSLLHGRYGNKRADLRIDHLDFRREPVMGDGLIDGMTGGYRLGGLIGCTTFCSLGLALDYRAPTIALGPSTAPADTGAPIHVPFELVGGRRVPYRTTGGSTFQVELPPSRIIVSATVEGRDLRLLLDTGSSEVTFGTSLSDSLLADGRPTKPQVESGMLGTTEASIFRLRTVSLGGAELSGVVALAGGTAADELLAGIGIDAGMSLDGTLGGSFLRAFHVTVDYDSLTLTLRPYPDSAHIYDEGIQSGLTIASPGPVVSGGLDVTGVIDGTDAAAKGVMAGDRLLSVDGKSLDGLASWQLIPLLHGQLGDTRQMVLRDAGTLQIRLDYDALALP